MKSRYLTILFFVFLSTFLYAQEICNNGVDDDGDGLIDLNDPDCGCNGFGTPQTIPSLIPNPSFEDKNCCPSTFSQLSCADTWIQATSATSDYFNCGYNFGAATNAGISAHTGSGYVGAIYSDSWKEYVGACLISPLLAGETYTLSFSIASVAMNSMGGVCGGGLNYGSVNVSIFGTTSCSNLPVSTTACPSSASPNWSLIGSASYSPSTSWGTIQIQITPTTNINAIMIGPPCGALPAGYSGGSCYAYFMYDDLILASNSFFNSISITPQGSFCTNDLQLKATTDSVGGTWQWYKGGVALVGETSDVLGISSNNYTAGTYQVRYTLGPNCDIKDFTVDPSQKPVADFNFSTVCLGLPTAFTDQSTFPLTGIENWDWDYNNDQVFDDVGANPSHVFPSDGIFNVTLRVTDSLGCTNEVTKPVQVYADPTANFSIDSVCLGTGSSIQDLSSINTANGNSITSWNWDFGDGNNSTSASPTQTFANPDIYNVKLVVESNHGCKDSIVQSTMISPIPTADFSIDSVCLAANSTIQDASTINSINGNSITSWKWDLGDGNSSADPNPQGYLYANAGIYDVQLIVTSNHGCKDTLDRMTVISPNPTADFSIDSVCLGTQSSIQNLSTINSSNGNSITSWTWDFGDGSSDNTENPINHLYANENVYDVQLIVGSNNGCSDTILKTTAIYPNPIVNFNVPNVCRLSASVFTDGSTVSTTYTSNQITNWAWDFGDGSTGNVQNPTHSYAMDSIYNVLLSVTTNHGCSTIDSSLVTVFPNPVANFSIDSVCQGNASIFQDLSNINNYNGDQITNWTWDFDDGQNSAIENPTHNYASENLYHVQLIIESNNGCMDSITKITAIYPNPKVDFSPTAVCLNFNTHFTDQTTLSNAHTNNSMTNWDWDFDDGSTSSDENPTHAYGSDGTYNAVLSVTTNHGCTNDTTLTVTVYPLPDVSFVGDSLTGCSPICPKISSTTTINSPSTLAKYEWTMSNGNTYQGNAISDCFNNLSGQDMYYNLTLKVTSDKGCVSSHSEANYIGVYHNPIADFYTTPLKPDIIHPKVQFHNTSKYEDTYQWFISDDPQIQSSEENPLFSFPEVPKKYYPELIVSTNKGCTDTAFETVRIRDRVLFYVPNTFTPDQDNYNEIFKPVFTSGYDPYSYTLLIYNRWGDILFESHDVNVGWDGTYGGKIVQDGTYVWKITFKESKTMSDKHHTKVGHVNVLR